MDGERFHSCEDTELALLGKKEAVLVHLTKALTYRLNSTGLFIWNDLESGLTAEEISERLYENYDVDMETAQRKVSEFIGHLRSLELIRPV
jgi:hypothetical protein